MSSISCEGGLASPPPLPKLQQLYSFAYQQSGVVGIDVMGAVRTVKGGAVVLLQVLTDRLAVELHKTRKLLHYL